MKKQRNFKLSDVVYQKLRDIAADDGTSLTETLEMLINSEYALRNQDEDSKHESKKDAD